MSPPAATRAARAEPRADAWTYASGRAAALEGSLLRRDALERLAEADSLPATTAALSDSPLRAALSEVETPAEVAEAITWYYAEALKSLEADCPFPALCGIVSLPARYEALKQRLRAALGRTGSGGISAADAAEMLVGFDPEGEAAAGLELALEVLAGDGAPEPELALDLALDSARLLEALRLAGSLGDAPVLEHVTDEVHVRAALLLWRSRLVAGEDGSTPAAEWIPRLFLRGALAAGMLPLLWSRPTTSWGKMLAEELTGQLGRLFGSGQEENLDRWEKAAFDWLTRRAGELRGEAFGVGRVYAYAWALGVEEHNVRLAVVGRLRGVKSAAVKALYWEGLL
jgi:hypothetical protein